MKKNILVVSVLMIASSTFAGPIEDLEQAVNDNNLVRVTEILNKDNSLLRDRSNDMQDFDSEKNLRLQSPIRNGNIEMVRVLIEHGVNPNRAGSDSFTALHKAASLGKIEIVKLLFNKGSRLNRETIGSDTALHLAAMQGHTEIVEFLIDNGADLHIPNVGGVTPLHSAAANDHLEVTQLLLERGANIDSISRRGNTPLMLALDIGGDTAALFLIQKGADTSVVNKTGEIALSIAKRKNSMVIKAFLSDRFLNESLKLTHLDDECGICLQSYNEQDLVSIESCRHTFHKDCINEWKKVTNNCPICKRANSDINIQMTQQSISDAIREAKSVKTTQENSSSIQEDCIETPTEK